MLLAGRAGHAFSVIHLPFVLSLSKDGSAALAWFDKLTTNG
ncbi:hypothetical protein [Croceibacterium soli]|nr:hypothetical protein [Croceibacterium soli]